ncbi:hypothetical protein P8X24_08315 [Pyrococcus kukulkanii]|uniref:hypothetical protein n=1 Tax=Pyrococcus kukulkanii TaxID=1609559 RepID=UPI003565B57D
MDIEEFMKHLKVGEYVRFDVSGRVYEGVVTEIGRNGFVIDDGEDEIFFSKFFSKRLGLEYEFV